MTIDACGVRCAKRSISRSPSVNVCGGWYAHWRPQRTVAGPLSGGRPQDDAWCCELDVVTDAVHENRVRGPRDPNRGTGDNNDEIA